MGPLKVEMWPGQTAGLGGSLALGVLGSMHNWPRVRVWQET